MEFVGYSLSLLSIWLTLECLSPYSKAEPKIKPWQVTAAWGVTAMFWKWLIIA